MLKWACNHITLLALSLLFPTGQLGWHDHLPIDEEQIYLSREDDGESTSICLWQSFITITFLSVLHLLSNSVAHVLTYS